MNAARRSLSVLGICLGAALPATTMAQTSQVAVSMSSHVMTEHPIKVNGCNPERNVSYNWSGYTPAYWPAAGPYYRGYWGWPSVYGATYYQAPVENNPTLGIDYMNATNVVMKQIEFGLIVKGSLVAEVKDEGTFSPGAEIKHKFGLSHNVFPLQTSYAKCVPLKIVFEDGSHWRNPHLPAYKATMYGAPHE